MSLFGYFLSGVAGGFCSSAPIGPINLWIVGTWAHHGKISVRWFIVGVVLVDAFFAALALWGYGEILANSNFDRYWQVFGAIVLTLLGFSLLMGSKRPRKNVTESAEPWGIAKPFLSGAFLCASNPAFLAFWLAVSASVIPLISVGPTPSLVGIFLVGVIIGDVLWFFMLYRLIAWTKSRARTIDIKMVQTVTAFLILFAGVFGLARVGWSTLKNTTWHSFSWGSN